MKVAITFMAVKTIVVEVTGNGDDGYEQMIDPSAIPQMVQKIELANADMLMPEWINNGETQLSVSVQELK